MTNRDEGVSRIFYGLFAAALLCVIFGFFLGVFVAWLVL